MRVMTHLERVLESPSYPVVGLLRQIAHDLATPISTVAMDAHSARQAVALVASGGGVDSAAVARLTAVIASLDATAAELDGYLRRLADRLRAHRCFPDAGDAP
ncbi:MAG: hypothetical protein KC635_28650 [Myxococcales bacterium]|nr:hypothetical protein [Myxococcales bacterium]MCB9732940.1 hypothetical protein [Deltaproteobacteria bacterium]